MGNNFYSRINVSSLGSPESSTSVPPKPRIPFDGCPLCKSQNTVELRTADCSKHSLYCPVVAPIMTWMRCNDCAHVFTDGHFAPEVATIIFANTHENQKPGWAFEQQRYVSARMVERVARYTKSGSWLDVGFGNGSLLFTAEEWGFKTVGLDLRPSSVEKMRQLGIESYCIDITALN